MRRCRKAISLIMLMVMLVSLLPAGAMAAEAPAGATNEAAAMEEPQDNTDAVVNEDITNEETDKPEDITADTSVSDAKEEGEPAADPEDEEPAEGETVEAAEDAGLGVTSTEIAAEEEPAEDAGAAKTTTEIAAEVEPTGQTAEKEKKAAGDEEYDLATYLSNLVPPSELITNLNTFEDDPEKIDLSNGFQIQYNSEYVVSLHFNAKGLVAGTYKAKLPQTEDGAFEYRIHQTAENEANNGFQFSKEMIIDDIPIGDMEVDEAGNVIFRLNENVERVQDMELDYEFAVKLKKTDTETFTIGDYEVPIVENLGSVLLTKSARNYNENPDKSGFVKKDFNGREFEDGKWHIRWTVEVHHDDVTSTNNGVFQTKLPIQPTMTLLLKIL